MELNQILKSFEQNQKFTKMFGQRAYNISVIVNDDCSKVFSNTKEFKKYFKEEYTKECNEMMYMVEFEEALGCVKTSFFALNELCTIEIYPTLAY